MEIWAKLLVKLELVGAGMYDWIAAATGSNLLSGIMLPGKGLRTTALFTVCSVAGS